MRPIFPILDLDGLTDEDNLKARDLLLLHETEFLNLEDIEYNLTQGSWHLWVDYTDDTRELCSVAITSFVEYPRLRALRIILTSGEFTDWSEATKYFEVVAKANGCDTLEILGRKGWERVLKDLGFAFQNITIQKRLT